MAPADYQIQSSAYRCAKSGRELQPGEKFFSVVYDRGSEFVREDVSQEAWQGPPPDAFSFWLAKAPPREPSRRPRFDDELLLDFFQRFVQEESDPKKVSFRYILALLLMRRRRLRLEEARIEGDRELLVLRCPRTRQAYRVVNPKLSDQALAEVQDEVQRVLGTS